MDEFKNEFSINSITKELKKESLCVKNRLQSILYDSYYVEKVASSLGLPLVPNERCGLWYVSPKKRCDTAYFKSTDGHHGYWNFSTRRLNLHILKHLKAHDGMVIVDSTRRGKLMPDALSKTIPIWCAVLNYVMYESEEDGDIINSLGLDYNDDLSMFLLSVKRNNWLRTSDEIISSSEKSQIIERIPSFALELKKVGITKEVLVKHLGGDRRPIVPLFQYPLKPKSNDQLFTEENTRSCPKFYSVYCLTASIKIESQFHRMVVGVRGSKPSDIHVAWNYVQGSADDHESWATSFNFKLGPDFWWNNVFNSDGQHNTQVIDSRTGYIHNDLTDEKLTEIINAIHHRIQDAHSGTIAPVDVTRVQYEGTDTKIWFGQIKSALATSQVLQVYPRVKFLVVLSAIHSVSVPENSEVTVIHHDVPSNKKGSRMLRDVSPSILSQLNLSPRDEIMILCDSGADISVGVVLLLLCTRFNASWTSRDVKEDRLCKELVKKHLTKLSQIRRVNPTRSTLQSVHSILF
ncbi:Piso0_002587 [Millerozyma farinosa CBS 7064]|uniref:Piso0_002587 protein n=1 Tax=Pichia sorbitophila (strain ATCC MYA-4447 / BCRC 22081 / CBS 7064 / NBRC 10061 / NRRL Y-12695) TaxID=559304 RepID=G8YFF9_PICSO|nr:Piso0_002587 [Millerozyma farinosa CBS 7064]